MITCRANLRAEPANGARCGSRLSGVDVLRIAVRLSGHWSLIMRFIHRGREVDTADMRSFETGHPYTPQIFVDNDQECFVAQNRAGWQEPKIRYVPRHEARRLADLYHVEELRTALTEKPPKHLVFHDRTTGRTYDSRNMRRIELMGQDGVVYVAEDRRCFSVEEGKDLLKELSKEEAEKLAEIFGRSELKEMVEGKG
jgi:hypothetical protein